MHTHAHTHTRACAHRHAPSGCVSASVSPFCVVHAALAGACISFGGVVQILDGPKYRHLLVAGIELCALVMTSSHSCGSSKDPSTDTCSLPAPHRRGHATTATRSTRKAKQTWRFGAQPRQSRSTGSKGRETTFRSGSVEIPPLATDNLLENTDGVLRTPISVLSRRQQQQPATSIYADGRSSDDVIGIGWRMLPTFRC